MDIVTVNNSQFTHYPKRIPRGTVNAELVQLRLDKEWEGLTVFWHWRNMGTKAEIREGLADPAEPRKIPWEVLTDLGELRMGLVGLDGETVIKPTIWLTYGYVVDGVDPEAGDDPQPPTPSWEQQMVALAEAAASAAKVAASAAKVAKETADRLQTAAASGEFNGDPGPQGPKGDTGDTGPKALLALKDLKDPQAPREEPAPKALLALKAQRVRLAWAYLLPHPRTPGKVFV